MNEYEESEVCECRTKATPRDAETLRQMQNRLNRIIGQLGGISRMLEENRYCGDVLTQIAAVESAIQSLGYMVLRDHLNTCVSERVKSGDHTIMDETIDLIKKLK